MIEINHVSKRYGKLFANNDLSFTVQDGELALLFGLDGAGKSTLLKSIAGLLRYKGRITLNGFSNHSTNAKRLLGYVPQYPAVYELLTIREHMEFIAKAYRLDIWEQWATELLHRFSLHEHQFKLGKELTFESRHRLSLCCALLHRPRVLLLDEPMNALDANGIMELNQLCTEWKAMGTSILISTTNLSHLDDDWDWTYVMVNGAMTDVQPNPRSPGSQPTVNPSLAMDWFKEKVVNAP